MLNAYHDFPPHEGFATIRQSNCISKLSQHDRPHDRAGRLGAARRGHWHHLKGVGAQAGAYEGKKELMPPHARLTFHM